MKEKFRQLHNEFNITPLTQSLNTGYPSKEMGKLLGMPPIPMLCQYFGHRVNVYFRESQWEDAGKIITEHALHNSGFFKKINRRSGHLRSAALKTLQGLDWKNINVISNKKLAILLKYLSPVAYSLSIQSQLAAIADHYHFTFSKRAQSIIENSPGFVKLKKPVSEIVGVLNVPTTGKLPSDRAKQELLKIKKQISKNPNLQNGLINKYLSRWFWLNYGHLGPALTKPKVLKELGNLKIDNHTKLRKNQILLENKLRLTGGQKNFFEAARMFVFLKSARVEICHGIFAFINFIVKRISKETGIKKHLLFYCTISELLWCLQKGGLPPQAVLKSRYKYSVWIAKDVFFVKVFAGTKARVFMKANALPYKKIAVTGEEVKGNVAFPGLATGRVKIINTPGEMKKMAKGDVLMAAQTTPELLPAMKMASAFVTDIGGIVSHAALVSREFKIPCIVGTRSATKVFKDGDLVEVDANKGIVKKLNQ